MSIIKFSREMVFLYRLSLYCLTGPEMKTNSPLIESSRVPLLKELNPIQLEALKFGCGAIFVSSTGGLLFGGVTSLMRGLQDTPAGRANLINSFKLFSNFHFVLKFCCILTFFDKLIFFRCGRLSLRSYWIDSFTRFRKGHIFKQISRWLLGWHFIRNL